MAKPLSWEERGTICDSCGKLYRRRDVEKVVLFGRTYDICKNCLQDRQKVLEFKLRITMNELEKIKEQMRVLNQKVSKILGEFYGGL